MCSICGGFYDWNTLDDIGAQSGSYCFGLRCLGVQTEKGYMYITCFVREDTRARFAKSPFLLRFGLDCYILYVYCITYSFMAVLVVQLNIVFIFVTSVLWEFYVQYKYSMFNNNMYSSIKSKENYQMFTD